MSMAKINCEVSPVETYQTESQYLKDIIIKFKEDLVSGTSAGGIEEIDKSPKVHKEFEVNGDKITLGLKL